MMSFEDDLISFKLQLERYVPFPRTEGKDERAEPAMMYAAECWAVGRRRIGSCTQPKCTYCGGQEERLGLIM